MHEAAACAANPKPRDWARRYTSLLGVLNAVLDIPFAALRTLFCVLLVARPAAIVTRVATAETVAIVVATIGGVAAENAIADPAPTAAGILGALQADLQLAALRCRHRISRPASVPHIPAVLMLAFHHLDGGGRRARRDWGLREATHSTAQKARGGTRERKKTR